MCKEKLLQVIQDSGVLSWSKERWQIVGGQCRVEHFVKCLLKVLHLIYPDPNYLTTKLTHYYIAPYLNLRKQLSCSGILIITFAKPSFLEECWGMGLKSTVEYIAAELLHPMHYKQHHEWRELGRPGNEAIIRHLWPLNGFWLMFNIPEEDLVSKKGEFYGVSPYTVLKVFLVHPPVYIFSVHFCWSGFGVPENLKPPPEKEDVKMECLWEGMWYYLTGEFKGAKRYALSTL